MQREYITKKQNDSFHKTMKRCRKARCNTASQLFFQCCQAVIVRFQDPADILIRMRQ